MPQRNFDQATHRRSTRVRDQHGRQWTITIDVNTMAPVGTPIFYGWNPPTLPNGHRLMPPQKYLQFDPNDLGSVRIDYGAWKNDLEIANEAWDRQLASLAAGMYGDKAIEVIERPTAQVLSLVGPRPFPVELAEACEDEDPWALGLVKETRKSGELIYHPVPKALAGILESMAPLRRRRATTTAPADDTGGGQS